MVCLRYLGHKVVLHLDPDLQNHLRQDLLLNLLPNLQHLAKRKLQLLQLMLLKHQLLLSKWTKSVFTLKVVDTIPISCSVTLTPTIILPLKRNKT